MIDEPLTDQQREKLATSAMQRVAEAVADYAKATQDDGDAETVTGIVVLYEACGLTDSEDVSGVPYSRHSFFCPDTPSISQAMGILTISGERLRHRATCTGCGTV